VTAPAHRAALPLALLAGLAAGTARAQEAGGLAATVEVTETLRVEENRAFAEDSAGVSAFSRTEIAAALATETRAQRLRFDLGATLDAGYFAEEDGLDAELDSWSAGLAYARESRDALVSLDLRYAVSDVTGTETVSDLDVIDAISAEGERAAADLALSLEVGRTASVGARLAADYRRRIFTDIADPDLFDLEEGGLDATVFLRPSRTLAFRLTGAARRYDAENEAETLQDRLEIGAGLDYALTPRLDLSADLGFTRIETTETEAGARTTETDAGPTGRLALTRAHPAGATRVALATFTETTGRRVEASLGRAFEFPTAALDVTLGATASDESPVRPFGRLSFTRETRRALFAVDLDQTVTVTAEDDEVLVTGFGVSYARELTPLSSLELAADFTDITLLAGEETEPRRDLALSATLSRQITRDWSGLLGVEYRLDSPEDAPDRQSTALFLGLTRTFSGRP